MNDLVLAELVFNKNGQPMTDSRRVAQYFEKDHDRVLKDVRNLNCSAEFRAVNFDGTSYIDSQNKERPLISMTRNGFVFLAMGYTGEKAGRLKEEYIKAFDKMEAVIKGNDVQRFDPVVNSCLTLESYLKVGALLGAPESLTKAQAVQYISRVHGVDYKPLLVENISTVQDKLCTATELGIPNKMSGRAINLTLEMKGLIKKVGKSWEMTPEGMEYGVYLDVGKKNSNGTPVQQIKWYKDKVSSMLSLE